MQFAEIISVAAAFIGMAAIVWGLSLLKRVLLRWSARLGAGD